jgi:hypothetical protein
MQSPDRLRRPFASLLGRELGTVGLAISREAMLAAAALAGLCIFAAVTALRWNLPLTAVPELLLAGMPLALLLPWLVWKGDPAFGRAFIWTLPVRRQHAALAKIAAGAVWLMLAFLAGTATLAVTALLTGGTVGLEEVRLVGDRSAGLAAAARVPWSTPFWMWLVPFGAALTLYFAGSAVLLGLRYPLRWIAGVGVAVILVVVVLANFGPAHPVEDALEELIDTIMCGRYGFHSAVSGGATSLSYEIDVPGPGSRELWTALPDARHWIIALILWLGVASVALALALRRHWER